MCFLNSFFFFFCVWLQGKLGKFSILWCENFFWGKNISCWNLGLLMFIWMFEIPFPLNHKWKIIFMSIVLEPWAYLFRNEKQKPKSWGLFSYIFQIKNIWRNFSTIQTFLHQVIDTIQNSTCTTVQLKTFSTCLSSINYQISNSARNRIEILWNLKEIQIKIDKNFLISFNGRQNFFVCLFAFSSLTFKRHFIDIGVKHSTCRMLSWPYLIHP